MKPLQPILDVLEQAANPRQRAMEASKPKPVRATSTAQQAFEQTMIRMQRLGANPFNHQLEMERLHAQQQAQTVQGMGGAGGTAGSWGISNLLRGGF